MNQVTLFLRSSICAAALAAVFAARAESLIWDNGGPNFINGWNLSNSIEDDFSFASGQTLESLDVYIYYQRDQFNDLFIKVDGSVVHIIARSSSIIGNLTGVPSVYKVSLETSDTFISAGTHRLEVGSVTKDGGFAWIWTDTIQLRPSTVNGEVRSEYAPTDVAFQLFANPVPEPSALALFVSALIGLKFARPREMRINAGDGLT
jgi:hypothetical protein